MMSEDSCDVTTNLVPIANMWSDHLQTRFAVVCNEFGCASLSKTIHTMSFEPASNVFLLSFVFILLLSIFDECALLLHLRLQIFVALFVEKVDQLDATSTK